MHMFRADTETSEELAPLMRMEVRTQTITRFFSSTWEMARSKVSSKQQRPALEIGTSKLVGSPEKGQVIVPDQQP